MNEKFFNVYPGDIAWLNYGSTNLLCLVIEISGSMYNGSPKNMKYKVFGGGEIIKINGWRLEKINEK